MHLNVSFAVLLLVIAVTQAGPTSKPVEKKTLSENAKEESKEENLQIEETGDEKERSKKAALCLDLGAGYSQTGQVSVSENQLSVQSIPLTVQAQTIPQQVQAVGFMQPQASLLFPQPMVQSMVQPMVQPIQTLQILPSQPCSHTAALNIIHTSAQVNQAAPTPAPESEVEPVTEPPKPAKIEEAPQPLPAPQESFALIPAVAAPCEQVMLLPRPEPVNFIQVSQAPAAVPCTNPLHRLTECTCQKVEPAGAALMSMIPYPPSYLSSAMTMPRNMISNQATVGSTLNAGPGMSRAAAMHEGSDASGRTYVSVNSPVPTLYQPHLHQHQIYPNLNMHGHRMEGVSNAPYGTHGGYPQVYRSASTMQTAQSAPESFTAGRNNYQENQINPEMYNRFQSMKVPREIDAEQLTAEKIDVSKQQQNAMLIDGRRNARSNKEEAEVELRKESEKI